MELHFKPKSSKTKGKEVYYNKSRFYVSYLINKSPKTWTELIKSSKLHQAELKRILDDLLSSKEVKKVHGKYSIINYPYWKYLNSPQRLKQGYLEKIKKVKLKDIFIHDPLITFPIDEAMFRLSEIEEINKNCNDILNSTYKIDKVIKNNRKKFIREKILNELEKSKPAFKKLLKDNIEDIILFISLLGKGAEISDIKYILKKRDSEISNTYIKFPYSYRSKFLKIILKISKETWRESPIILSTVWI